MNVISEKTDAEVKKINRMSVFTSIQNISRKYPTMFPRRGKLFTKLMSLTLILMLFKASKDTDRSPGSFADEGDSAILRILRRNTGKPANGSATWVSHLCPKYDPSRNAKLWSLFWEEPSEKAILFSQTSCGVVLSPREVSDFDSPLMATVLSYSLSLPLLRNLLFVLRLFVGYLEPKRNIMRFLRYVNKIK